MRAADAVAAAGGARRRWRWLRWALGLLLGYPAAVLCGMEPALAFDWAINLGDVPLDPALCAPVDGVRRLVVLQHGLWRTPLSLGRLERALLAHGYEVLDPGYPSRACTLQEASALLAATIEAYLARDAAGTQAAPLQIAFVGHSMGGLVVQEYLRRPDAKTPFACVYVAVPHRGAMLCDLRKNWWPFPLLLGDRAALQLSPGDAFHRQAIPHVAQSGAIVGDVGDGNDAIPGHDDGTVAVDEATLSGAADVVRVPLGHTAIAGSALTVRQVLAFLRHGHFARE